MSILAGVATQWTVGWEQTKDSRGELLYPPSAFWVVRDERGQFIKQHSVKQIVVEIATDIAARRGLDVVIKSVS